MRVVLVTNVLVAAIRSPSRLEPLQFSPAGRLLVPDEPVVPVPFWIAPRGQNVMRSLKTQTLLGGTRANIVFARFAPSRNARRSSSARVRQLSAVRLGFRKSCPISP